MIDDIIKYHIDNEVNKRTPLCSLFEDYGSDKSTRHNYSGLYSKLFKRYEDYPATYLEVGLGTNNTDVLSNMGPDGKPGASLRAISTYYSKWTIVGLDIDRRVLFQEPERRISTFFVDQLSPETIWNLWMTELPDIQFDIILDDGLHLFEANRVFFENSFHKLKEGGLYIIEDIFDNVQLDLANRYFANLPYRYHIVQLPSEICSDNTLVIIEK
jgi:SAM-dependent methyltransferase